MAAQYYLAKVNALCGRASQSGGLGWGERDVLRSDLQRAIELDPTLLFKVKGLSGLCSQLGINAGGAELLGALLGNVNR